MGSSDLDQRPPAMKRHTMGSWLPECPSCGYVAASIGQIGENDRALVRDAEYQRLRSETFSRPEMRRFILRAKLDSMQENVEGAFSNLLCAAWIADDGRQEEQARQLRLKAAGFVAGKAGISIDTKLRLLDAYRRSSAWDAAHRLAAELKAERLDYPFAEIIDFHIARIDAKDAGAYTIADAVPERPRPRPQPMSPVQQALFEYLIGKRGSEGQAGKA